MTKNYEALARELEISPDYRVLRRLSPRDVFNEVDCKRPYVGVVIDCETTSLDVAQAEVIELAMIKFHYTVDGVILRIIESLVCWARLVTMPGSVLRGRPRPGPHHRARRPAFSFTNPRFW